jgi:hypothetical protein
MVEADEMSSQVQTEANRVNARSSTGPRTPEGKRRVSLNALKHGLTGRQVAMPTEDPEEFDSFRNDLLNELDPQGAVESALTEQIVINSWRLRRAAVIEAAYYRRGCHELVVKRTEEDVERRKLRATERLFGHPFEPEEERLAREGSCRVIAAERAKLDEALLKVTSVLENSPTAFSNLIRYENAASRSLLRLLRELQRLQAIRAGEKVPALMVVDVDVSNAAGPLDEISMETTSRWTTRDQQV